MRTLIKKYLERDLSDAEMEEFAEWLRLPANQEEFEEFIRASYDIKLAVSEVDLEQKFNEVLRLTQKEAEKPVRKLWTRFYKYAAIGIVTIGIGYVLQQQFFSNSKALIIPDESITLQLEDGSIEVIDPQGYRQVVDANGTVVGMQNAGEIVYNQVSETEVLSFNTLNIPYGKKFNLLLSDGTVVHLNSGSSIKYPIKFLDGNREVILKGEAYFDVASDKAHPFIVNANEMNVEVLGTKFNVIAYDEDPSTDVVLVEGAVQLSDEDQHNTVKLSPGMKGSLQKDSADEIIQISNVNTELYTSWMDGRIVFRDMPFGKIIKKLERQYNVKIVNENAVLEHESFSGSLEHESIETILSYFSDLYAIEFKIEDNTIYIK